MPGALRVFLAAMVVLSHLIGTPYYEHLGYYAVRAFFVLSGFAMTGALNDVYYFDARRFWTNRFLRLAPPYLISCLLTAFAIHAFPAQAASFMPRWALPQSSVEVAENLFIVPLAFPGLHFRFIEPAWSLAVEIIFYVVLWLSMARSARGALICFANGAVFHCYALWAGSPFGSRYFSMEAALLSFSFGALIYFARERIALLKRPDFVWLVTFLWLANFLGEGGAEPAGYAETAGYYINIALSGLVVASQSTLRPGLIARRIDGILGDLSYPIFLVQWLGAFAAYVLLSPAMNRGWEIALLSTPTIMLCAAVLAWLNARSIEPFRWRLRNKEDQPTPMAFGSVWALSKPRAVVSLS